MSLTWEVLNIDSKELHSIIMTLLWELYKETAKFLGIRLTTFETYKIEG